MHDMRCCGWRFRPCVDVSCVRRLRRDGDRGIDIDNKFFRVVGLDWMGNHSLPS